MATSAELSSILDVHPVGLRRLLGTLRFHGLVESRTGPKGGWAMARDPAAVTLAAVYRAVAPEPEIVTPHALDEALVRAEAYVAQLEPVTIGSLIGGSS